MREFVNEDTGIKFTLTDEEYEQLQKARMLELERKTKGKASLYQGVISGGDFRVKGGKKAIASDIKVNGKFDADVASLTDFRISGDAESKNDVKVARDQFRASFIKAFGKNTGDIVESIFDLVGKVPETATNILRIGQYIIKGAGDGGEKLIYETMKGLSEISNATLKGGARLIKAGSNATVNIINGSADVIQKAILGGGELIYGGTCVVDGTLAAATSVLNASGEVVGTLITSAADLSHDVAKVACSAIEGASVIGGKAIGSAGKILGSTETFVADTGKGLSDISVQVIDAGGRKIRNASLDQTARVDAKETDAAILVEKMFDGRSYQRASRPWGINTEVRENKRAELFSNLADKTGTGRGR